MNTDIRLGVNFFNHIKTLKLEKCCGKEGVLCLLKLWVWAAVNRPSGDLSGYCSEDLELFCGWTGEPGLFFETLRDVGWVDVGDDGTSPRLHGWGEFQTWVTDAARREDISRLGALARKNRTAYERLKAQGVKGITKEEYAKYLHWSSGFSLSNAPAPAPAPSPVPVPVPVPVPTPKRKYRGAEKTNDQKDKKPETDFQSKWEGEAIQRASPLDYIRKIREIAENAPKIPERRPGVKRSPELQSKIPDTCLESEENTNDKGQEQHDGRRAA